MSFKYDSCRPSRVWRGVLFLSLICAIIGLETRLNSAQVPQLRERAEEAYRAGRLDEAIRLYKQAIDTDRSWEEGWRMLGQAYFDSGAFLDARNALRRAVSIDPENAAAWGRLGLSEFQVREYDRAMQSLFRSRSLPLADEGLSQQVKLHQAMLLSRVQQFEASFLILFDLAYHLPRASMVRTALGISALRLPFLPEEVPGDRKEAVELAGQVMGSLADFRLEQARETYGKLLGFKAELPNVEFADPERLLRADASEGFPINSASEVKQAAEVSIPDQDLVLGVVLAGEARAYPVNYMNGPMNEAVNDVVGATPILSTW